MALEVATTLDDPAGAPAWSPFRDASCLATRVVNGYAAPDSCYNNFFAFLDAPAAGTYTYAVRAGPHASTTNVRLNASTSTGSAGPASLKAGLRLRTE